ncbi:MAG TPA: ABC transporter ATP-binding protein, partial [Elusimicrobiales bacterium]|nr:ABC transporter ATP-binding protein [Elusimicrobiales bacterium]
MQTPQPLLEIKDLSVEFRFDGQRQHALRGLSYRVFSGETVAVVGESGSGKTVQALAALGLLPEQAQVSAGEILFSGEDLLKFSSEKLRAVRGTGIAMVFQDPMTSLNPALTIGRQVTEAFKTNDKTPELRRKATQLLAMTGIRQPEKRLDQYPHQLSGGMRQRVLLAMALACDPKVLIADEPTTALDVTVQAQLIAQLKRLQREKKMALVMITHNMGIVGQ